MNTIFTILFKGFREKENRKTTMQAFETRIFVDWHISNELMISMQ